MDPSYVIAGQKIAVNNEGPLVRFNRNIGPLLDFYEKPLRADQFCYRYNKSRHFVQGSSEDQEKNITYQR